MAARDVQFVQGRYYHIFNRGAHQASICLDEEDFQDIVRRIKEYAAKFSIAIIAYCLMPNHYHWLVRQDGVVEARMLPQRVFNGYAKRFNNRHHQSGTLFEGPFRAKLVDQALYLRHLPRYIHANPVKDGFATSLELWPYSNYAEWIGTRNGTLVDHEFIATFFPSRAAYRQSVIDYLLGHDTLPPAMVRYLARLYGDDRETI
jgi:REP element-mobilizing transposase RayT